jgi:hypothetical protein
LQNKAPLPACAISRNGRAWSPDQCGVLNGKPAPWQIPYVTRQKKIQGTEILALSSLSGNGHESQRSLNAVKIEICSINPIRAVMSIPIKIDRTRTPQSPVQDGQNLSRFCPDLTNRYAIF